MSLTSDSSEKLRILFVLRAPIGGLFRHVMDLCDLLGDKGHDLGLVCDDKIEDAQTIARLEQCASKLTLGVHRMPMARLVGFSDTFSIFRIRKLAKKLNVEIIHGHGAKGGLNARVATFGRAGMANCYTPHGGVLNYDETKPLGRLLRVVERGLLSVSSGIIFESVFAQSEFQRQVADPTCAQIVALNGLSENEFEKLDSAVAQFDFTFIGELRNVKRVDMLLRALAPLKNKKGKPASLVLAGDGPQAKELKDLAISLGLQDRAKFVGVQPAREVLAQGQCVVMPSSKESLPYVALEASAAGKPLIATDVGGVKEIFGPTAQSLLPVDDEQALRDAMQSFLDHPELAQEEAQQRHDFVRQNFAMQAMVDQIEALYFELAKTA